MVNDTYSCHVLLLVLRYFFVLTSTTFFRVLQNGNQLCGRVEIGDGNKMIHLEILIFKILKTTILYFVELVVGTKDVYIVDKLVSFHPC